MAFVDGWLRTIDGRKLTVPEWAEIYNIGDPQVVNYVSDVLLKARFG